MTKRKDKVEDEKGWKDYELMGGGGGEGKTNEDHDPVQAQPMPGTGEGTTADEEQADEHSYVKIGDVKLGDKLIVLGDEFDCIHDGDEKEVKQDQRGRLYVECEEGCHWLDKTDIHDYVVGLGTRPAKAV